METWAESHFVVALLFFLGLSILASVFAVRLGFFRPLSANETRGTVPFREVVGGFGTYLIIMLLFYPIVVLLLKKTPSQLRSSQGGWVQLIYLLTTFVALSIFLFWKRRESLLRLVIPRLGVKKQAISFGIGALTWCLAYPWVYTMNLISDRVAISLWGDGAIHEQTAVSHLKSTTERPLLYALTVISIVILVPLMEELLFRGLLQTWLRKYLGRIGSLIVTACIFAAVHYSSGQSNFSLICSLLVLSLFLGYLYEREQTLLASFGLHATFNAFTVLFLALQT